MRRLPVYFLIDVSESMVGTPVEQVQHGMRTIIQSLRVDPYALETVFVSVIAFAGKSRELSPLTELYKFYPPTFPIGGGTSLGAALDALMDSIDHLVQKTTRSCKGDWKPIIFLMTDGNPTDSCEGAINRWNQRYRRHCNLIAVSIGDNVNTSLLGRLTENVLRLLDTDAESFSRFFKWITASIQITSQSVTDTGSEQVKLAPTTGINLEKVDPHECCASAGWVDENFVVLHGRCQTTGNDYLVKYGRRSQGLDGVELFKATDFKLVGAYTIDGPTYAAMSTGARSSINTRELVGVPACPCCGNQLGVVVCECGGIFCVGDQGVPLKCPWCGMQGELGSGGAGGFDITRGLG